MPGCCLGALLLFFGPRVVLFLAWFLGTGWYRAFESRPVALLGFFLLPWTSLAWMFVFFEHHGAISGGYVLLLVAGAVADLSAYGGSHAARRRSYSDY